jgi:signal recognition particle subunit SRP54
MQKQMEAQGGGVPKLPSAPPPGLTGGNPFAKPGMPGLGGKPSGLPGLGGFNPFGKKK